jgi:hypothetical protein
MRFARRTYLRVKNRIRARYEMFQARKQLMPDAFDGERVGRWIGQAMMPICVFGFGGMLTVRTHAKVTDRLIHEHEPRGSLKN